MEVILAGAVAILIGLWLLSKLKKQEPNSLRTALPRLRDQAPFPRPLTRPNRDKPVQETRSQAQAAAKSAEVTRLEIKRPGLVENSGCWVQPGEAITVHGHVIPGGMIYFGTQLTRVSGYDVEPALINPRLPIATPQGAETGIELPYWPSYTEISNVARGLYLQWLSQGRTDQTVDIGLVFLFLYGLERRILTEKAEITDIELKAVADEIGRLLKTYGDNGSFRGYASQLLGIVESQRLDSATLLSSPPNVTKSYDSANLPLKVGLGLMVNAASPIPASWALALVRSRDDFYERTPAVRCAGEFERLFALRYREECGDGVVLKPNKSRIKVSYRPASASFPEEVQITVPDLPDVTVLKQPAERLVSLALRCTDELDAYSRHLGRNPEERETPAAVSLLPTALLAVNEHSALNRVSRFLLGQKFTDGLATVSYGELLAHWPQLPARDLAKKDCVMLAQCLEKIGFAFEPDIRFGNHQLRPSEQIILFQIPVHSPSAPSRAYVSATLLVHLGAMLASIDEKVTVEEENSLMAHVSGLLELSDPERMRLRAYLTWLLLSPPELVGLKKRLEPVSAERKTALGSFLARLASADGHIAPEEINLLQKMYRLLGLDPTRVYADMHSAVSEPIAVTPRSEVPGFSIPKPPVPPVRGQSQKVNNERVRAMEEESNRVASLLKEIFVSEEEVVSSNRVSVEDVRPRLLGLDIAHSAFLRELLEQMSWKRSALEDVASRHQLLPEGAIDAVNEAALDAHGESLFEGDDPIEVNQTVRKELSL